MPSKSLPLSLCLILAGCATAPQEPQAARAPARTEPPPAPAPAPTRAPAPPAVLYTLASAGLPDGGMWKCDPVLADVNGDGHLDLAAIPRLGAGPRVWLNDGRGGWSEASNGLKPERPSCGGGLAVADLNGDGLRDLAVADHCAGVFVYLGDGRGNWEVATASLNPRGMVVANPEQDQLVGAEDLDVGDVNGDGHHDLLVAGSDEGGLNIYYGDGTGRSWTRASTPLPHNGWGNRVALADVNCDGRLDALASYSAGPRVWINRGAGDWQPASEGLPSPMVQGLYHGLAAGDVNGDGRIDLAVANWVDGPEVYLQQREGTWRKVADVFPQMRGGAVGLALGRLNGDAHLDMLVSGRLSPDAGYVRGVFVLLGDGTGRYQYVQGSGLPETGLSGVAGVAVGDVNADGWADVALASGLLTDSGPPDQRRALAQPLLLWCARPGAMPGTMSEVFGSAPQERSP